MFCAHAVPWVFIIMISCLTGASISSLTIHKFHKIYSLFFCFLEEYYSVFIEWFLIKLVYKSLCFVFIFACLSPPCIYTQPHACYFFFCARCHCESKTCILTSLVFWYGPFCTCMSHLQTVHYFNPFTRLRETHKTCKNPGGFLRSAVQQSWQQRCAGSLVWPGFGCVCAPSSLGGPLATQSSREDDQELNTTPDFLLKLLGRKKACFPFLINIVAEC